MKQKFKKLSFVKVTDELPESMHHFQKGFVAIVDGTYSQIYGGKNVNSYALYKVVDGKVVNRLSWYYENQLTLLPDQNPDVAEQMIEDYNFSQ